MQMSLQDRLVIGAFLPQKDDMLTMIVADQVRKKCRLTEADFATIAWDASDPTRPRYNPQVARETVSEIELSDSEKTTLRAGLDRLNSKKEITLEILDTAIKIKGI